jgi:hypothetical protein
MWALTNIALVWCRLIQNSEKTQQTQSDFLDFVIGQALPEFLLVNGPELLDSLTAQLLWCFHSANFINAWMLNRGGWI